MGRKITKMCLEEYEKYDERRVEEERERVG